MRTCVHVGRDVRRVGESRDGIELEGRSRLRPGSEIDLVLPDPHGASRVVTVRVWSWTIVAVGSNGPVFRGVCRRT